MQNNLNHLAIIMDGNARWAEKNNKSRAEGHRQGAKAAKSLLYDIKDLGLKYLTLYAFSSENWKRSEGEVSSLLDILTEYLTNDLKIFLDNNIRLKVIGDLSKLSYLLQHQINRAVKLTENNSSTTVVIAFSYGSRAEIVNACNSAIKSDMRLLKEKDITQFLYDPEMPDVDLLIRTSGMYRLSNFLLWQSAYAELYFLETLWPDFTKLDLEKAINEYFNRQRTFGNRIV